MYTKSEHTKSEQTKVDILRSACSEFVEAGYNDASMRTIASNANVTTGAIYRYYKDKDALFCEVTKEAYTIFNNTYNDMSKKAMEDADEGFSYTEIQSDDLSGMRSNLQKMYDIVYEKFDLFYLLVCYSQETSLGSFVHNFVDMETKTTYEYIERLKKKYNSDFEIDKNAFHSICEAYVVVLFEPIKHRMSKREALQSIRFIEQFFIDGWLGVERIIIGR
ncbi:MAG: TetR/AcrR family transcriptional regulator [Suipraeoptans sp.]